MVRTWKYYIASSYTLGTRGLPDIYTLSPHTSCVYIRQATRVHGITIKYTLGYPGCEKYINESNLVLVFISGVYLNKIMNIINS